MVDYLEILRLSSKPKNSQRCIASIVHCSRHTIRAVLEAVKKAGLSWPLDDTVTNEMLKRILFPERATTEALHTQPDYPYIHHSPSENTVFGRIFYAIQPNITRPEPEIAKKERLSPQISAIFLIFGITVLR